MLGLGAGPCLLAGWRRRFSWTSRMRHIVASRVISYDISGYSALLRGNVGFRYGINVAGTGGL